MPQGPRRSAVAGLGGEIRVHLLVRLLDEIDRDLFLFSGNAVGLDRLIALCLGAASIGDVQTFPSGWL